ncbi:MAG TPA: glutathione S-transferase N-terminal domain-containing protein [Labilithrix sp.]|nr:glutathione S-transferase N-terminal domain-containing protein [Labilithrix sp.]
MADAELVLILGNKNLSSWSLRPWVLLRQAGIPFTERVLPFETPGWREAIVALSPSGRVPALHHGDIAIWDSLAICEYVAELFPDKQLWPAERAARALARSVSAEIHSGFSNLRGDLPMDVIARVPRRPRSRETENDVARVLSLWTECRSRAGASAGGPFLFGRFSIADAMFAPVAWRFRTYDVPIEDAAARAYCDALLALPAMKEWEEAAAAEVAALRAAAVGARGGPDPTSAQHCFAVIFTSQRKTGDDDGYAAAAAAMDELAARQPGYLGIESARNPNGFGITVSYWDSLEAIRNWKDVPAHAAVQAQGRKTFYERYEVRVAVVERGYRFPI